MSYEQLKIKKSIIYQDSENSFPFFQYCKVHKDYRHQPSTRILLPSRDKPRHTHCSENVELYHEFPVELKAIYKYSRNRILHFNSQFLKLFTNREKKIKMIVVRMIKHTDNICRLRGIFKERLNVNISYPFIFF